MRRFKLISTLTLFLAFGLTYSGLAQSTDYYDDYSYDSTVDTYEYNSGSTYDVQSGNSYNWNTDINGTTTVNGYNYNTGSTWQTQIESDGDMSGYDSDYNNWDYNRSTKTYYNYGTGEMRSNGIEISPGIESSELSDLLDWDY